jgi:glycine betaine/proline transport system substrate-binding protein
MRVPRIKLLLLVVLVIATSACAAPGAQPQAAARDVTIRLAENPWSGSRANVAVAQQLLESELGYEVEVVTLDENAQWTALANGDIHASLEVWPSGHAENIAQYIEDQGVVENGGLLGPVGKIGWWVPTYVIEAHPELATWEGFTDPELAGLFSTAETGNRGQFLAGDPSWVQYDEDIIQNLGLHLQVVHAGSEEALLAALDSAYSREAPILFYFYTPHSIFNRYELTQVQLPPYSEECYAREAGGGIDCDYPPDNLFKIFWTGLAEAAPDAHQLLSNFNYSTGDQIDIIASIEVDGQSPEDAAREWIEANEATWRAWLPD